MPRASAMRSTKVKAISPTDSRHSFDHLIRTQQNGFGDLYAERLGRLHVDHQLKLGGLLNRQSVWISAVKDLINVTRGLSEQSRIHRSIGEEPTVSNVASDSI